MYDIARNDYKFHIYFLVLFCSFLKGRPYISLAKSVPAQNADSAFDEQLLQYRQAGIWIFTVQCSF